MSAELLRKAATILRERAEDATEGPWFVHEMDTVFVGNRADGRTSGLWRIVHASADRLPDLTPHAQRRERSDAAYIATMHPGVGLALADWLEYTAELLAIAEEISDVRDRPFKDPLALARLIVGEQA